MLKVPFVFNSKPRYPNTPPCNNRANKRHPDAGIILIRCEGLGKAPSQPGRPHIGVAQPKAPLGVLLVSFHRQGSSLMGN